jgi:glycosyltransferase involved in cell wall biosynthesis
MASSSPPDPAAHGTAHAPRHALPSATWAAPDHDAGPDLSVVIPAWNEERHVGQALASLAAQTWPRERWEALVVDNGSEDGTARRVRAFQAAHPDCRVSLLQLPARGRGRAKNAGARCAAGRLLVFLDADSWAERRLFEAIAASAAAGYPAGSIRIVADGANWADRGFFALMEFGKRRFGIRAQMFYCRRDLFLAHGGFDEALEIAEDLDFLRRLQRAGHPVCYLRRSWIATSPRRLHTLPLRLGLLVTFVRWTLARARIGRRWRY